MQDQQQIVVRPQMQLKCVLWGQCCSVSCHNGFTVQYCSSTELCSAQLPAQKWQHVEGSDLSALELPHAPHHRHPIHALKDWYFVIMSNWRLRDHEKLVTALKRHAAGSRVPCAQSCQWRGVQLSV